VDPGLVFRFNCDAVAGKTSLNPCVDLCFGRLREICGVEIEQIVVLDVGFGRLARTHIPGGLEKASRHQPRIRQLQRGQVVQNQPVVAVFQGVPDEIIRAHRVRRPQGNQTTLAIDAQT
jgi:hypothetical protein